MTYNSGLTETQLISTQIPDYQIIDQKGATGNTVVYTVPVGKVAYIVDAFIQTTTAAACQLWYTRSAVNYVILATTAVTSNVATFTGARLKLNAGETLTWSTATNNDAATIIYFEEDA